MQTFVWNSHSLGVGRTVSTVGSGKRTKGIVVSGGGGKVGAGVIVEPTTIEEVENWREGLADHNDRSNVEVGCIQKHAQGIRTASESKMLYSICIDESKDIYIYCCS